MYKSIVCFGIVDGIGTCIEFGVHNFRMTDEDGKWYSESEMETVWDSLPYESRFQLCQDILEKIGVEVEDMEVV